MHTLHLISTAHAHSDKLIDSDLPINFTASDYDGANVLVERREDTLLAAYAYGPFGPIARTGLMNPEGPCVRWLLSDGRGTTSGSADDAGNIQIQHFDAFGVALETAVISTCPMPNCQTCERGRRATGELGYHGQEGYRTRHYDAYRAEDLPNKSPDHPEYDENYQEGYETPSTGFMQVGARDYDPTIGRWLEVDPAAAGPEMRTGQLNRWVYCANDPLNLSDPLGLDALDVSLSLAGSVSAWLGGVYALEGSQWAQESQAAMAWWMKSMLKYIVSVLMSGGSCSMLYPSELKALLLGLRIFNERDWRLLRKPITKYLINKAIDEFVDRMIY